ncbi:hypothetical protein BH23ACT7_BH23ACT7_03380 [soil metagenome]|nr:hypothetical protein [Euzebyaceae bacterium]
MRSLLIVLTAVEIVVFLGAVVVYLIAIAGSLRRTAVNLGKVSFGVRAIETQCAPIGPAVTRINAQLATIVGALGGVAELAERLAAAGDGKRQTPLERVVDRIIPHGRADG